MAKKENHYIDNKQFLADMKIYLQECKEAEANDEPVPSVPANIGKALLDIAEGLSKRPNFARYTYRSDMVMDAVENSLKAVRNFDPDKSSNPFGYFTRISWFAFLRTIKKEQRHETMKFNIIKHAINASAVTQDQYYDILKNKGYINRDVPLDEIKELTVFDEMAEIDVSEVEDVVSEVETEDESSDSQ